MSKDYTTNNLYQGVVQNNRTLVEDNNIEENTECVILF